jgi:hypothetical protein
MGALAAIVFVGLGLTRDVRFLVPGGHRGPHAFHLLGRTEIQEPPTVDPAPTDMTYHFLNYLGEYAEQALALEEIREIKVGEYSPTRTDDTLRIIGGDEEAMEWLEARISDEVRRARGRDR